MIREDNEPFDRLNNLVARGYSSLREGVSRRQLDLHRILNFSNCMQATTEKTNPLESDGAFMLGNEQDCYGGCTDSTQAFYGLMDEVTSIRTRTSAQERCRKVQDLGEQKGKVWRKGNGRGLAVHCPD